LTVVLIVMSLLDIYLFYLANKRKMLMDTARMRLASILALVVPVALVLCGKGYFQRSEIGEECGQVEIK
jgi:hypothetical protein